MSNARTNVRKLRGIDYPAGAVGDGTALDGAALAAHLASGLDLYLPPGSVFNITGVILSPPSNVRIYGGGRLKKTTIAAGGEQFIRIDGVSNVVVDGIEFEDTRVSGGRSYGVTTLNASNITISNNRFVGYVTPVFVWRLSNRVSVIDNDMSNGGDFGVATGGDFAGNTNGVVSNVIIRGNRISGKTGEAIDINWDTQGCVVEGNVCAGNNLTAGEEEIDIGGGVCRDITVSNNVIDGNNVSAAGISVKLDTQRVVISGNTIRKVGVNAIRFPTTGVATVRQVQIRNNTLFGETTATGAGIDLYDCSAVDISGNAISGFAGDGITVRSTATNGSISGNTITTCEDGIVCLGANTTINGNNVFACVNNGINLQALNLTCSGNTCYASGQWGLVLSAGSNFAVITGNHSYDPQGTSGTQNGLNVTGACDRVLIVGNTFWPVDTTATTGTGSLTNSVVANNLTS